MLLVLSCLAVQLNKNVSTSFRKLCIILISMLDKQIENLKIVCKFNYNIYFTKYFCAIIIYKI